MSKNFWMAVLAGGIVANALDFVVQGNIFQSMFYSKMQGMRTDVGPGLYIALDFVAVAVFVWFYDRVSSNFGGGLQGGMKFGFYYGIALNFPMMFFPYLMYQGMMYGWVWASIIYGVIWAMAVGTVVGKIYTKSAPTA